MNTSAIVQKLWNYGNVLGDDGMSYGDYVEKLTLEQFREIATDLTEKSGKAQSTADC